MNCITLYYCLCIQLCTFVWVMVCIILVTLSYLYVSFNFLLLYHLTLYFGMGYSKLWYVFNAFYFVLTYASISEFRNCYYFLCPTFSRERGAQRGSKPSRKTEPFETSYHRGRSRGAAPHSEDLSSSAGGAAANQRAEQLAPPLRCGVAA